MGLKKILAGAVILLFSFAGFFLSGNVLHELSHRYDFRDIEKKNESTCFLSFSDNVGYYSFSASPDQYEKIQEIDKYTEFKAYSIDGILMLIYFTSLFFAVKYFKD